MVGRWKGSPGSRRDGGSPEWSVSKAVRLGKVQPQAPSFRTIYCNDREANAPLKYKGNSVSITKYDILTFLPKGLVFIFIYSGFMWPRDQLTIYFTIYILMNIPYFYLMFLLVPVAALSCDFLFLGVQRWFFPYDYQIIQEIHRYEPDAKAGLEIVTRLSPEESRSYAMMQLPGAKSRHTGYAFESPGYESFFASQAGAP